MTTPNALVVRSLAAGETLRVYPLEPSICWFRVHTMGKIARPCLLQDCPECRAASLCMRPYWCGFLLVVEQSERAKPFILRLSEQAYKAWNMFGGVPSDLRLYLLSIARGDGRGRARLVISREFFVKEDLEPFHRPSLVPQHLMHWWTLPTADPDYLQAVQALQPLSAPHPGAFPLHWLQAAREEGGPA